MKPLCLFVFVFLFSCSSIKKNNRNYSICEEEVTELFSKYEIMASLKNFKEITSFSCNGNKIKSRDELIIYLNNVIIKELPVPEHVALDLKSNPDEKKTIFIISSYLNSVEEVPIDSNITIKIK